MYSLETIRSMFGEEEKEISYLKLDVEGYEIKAMPDWPESGALNNVKQVQKYVGGFFKKIA